MVSPVVHCEADPEAASERAAHLLAEAIEEALELRGAAHVALSGGSTPRRAYELLGGLVRDWAGVHLWFADERCVGPDDPESNARLVRETLYAPGAETHRIEGELGAEAAASAYERALGDVVLDVVLLGLGPDGHTASLFPDNAALEAAGRVAPVHDAPKPPPDRVTLTRPTIDLARRRILLVTGAEKARALAGALGEPTPHVPGSLVRREDLDVIVDPAALGEVRPASGGTGDRSRSPSVLGHGAENRTASFAQSRHGQAMTCPARGP